MIQLIFNYLNIPIDILEITEKQKRRGKGCQSHKIFSPVVSVLALKHSLHFKNCKNSV